MSSMLRRLGARNLPRSSELPVTAKRPGSFLPEAGAPRLSYPKSERSGLSQF